jgi:hypothetical protein
MGIGPDTGYAALIWAVPSDLIFLVNLASTSKKLWNTCQHGTYHLQNTWTPVIPCIWKPIRAVVLISLWTCHHWQALCGQPIAYPLMPWGERFRSGVPLSRRQMLRSFLVPLMQFPLLMCQLWDSPENAATPKAFTSFALTPATEDGAVQNVIPTYLLGHR